MKVTSFSLIVVVYVYGCMYRWRIPTLQTG